MPSRVKTSGTGAALDGAAATIASVAITRGKCKRYSTARGVPPPPPEGGRGSQDTLVLYHRRRALRLNYAITHILYNKVGGSVYLITALYLSINLAIDNAVKSCYNESAANGLPFKRCQSFRAARSSILLTCWRHLYNIRLIPLFQGGFLIFPPLFQQSNPRNCHNRTCIPVFCDIYSPYPKTHTT